MKIVADTSVWIDFFNGQSNRQTSFLKKNLSEDRPIYFIPVIIQEILQGIKREESFEDILDLISGFPVMDTDPVVDAIEAARLYRSLRKRGITIRKSNDCLIASICIRNDALLVFRDRDFDLIARHSPLQIFE